ncbi:MAG: AI-2E family transporter [Planctomycetes bacterium]|nr:AI-2E family transporter [Planctomycetota bacterium]
MPDAVPPSLQPDEAFRQRVLLICRIVLAALALIIAMVWCVQVLIVVFAGVLGAVLLRTIAERIHRMTRLPTGWSLALGCTTLLAVLVTAGWLMAPSVGAQLDQLSEQLPRAVRGLTANLEQYEWGRWLKAQGEQATNGGQGTVSTAAKFVSTTVGIGGTLLVVFFLSIYLAAQPQLYISGLLHLFPIARRQRVHAMLDECGFELRWWLLGQLFAMLLVGTLTTLGLWALGLPLALILGVIAGLLNFVPNFGPWIAAVPGILIALSQGPTTAAWAAGVYLGAQVIESYLVTPMIQQRTVSLPPALTIAVQVLIGLLLGIVGLTIATPLLVVILVIVKMGYVEGVIGEHVDLPGRDRDRKRVPTPILSRA